jgi:pyruvate dehydrogenase (quinone)/pyruvate oxidase
MVFLGNPEFGVNMAGLDFVGFAEAAGGRGMRIEDPASCAERLREAFSWDGPVIVECVVDQHEPPMPAKVKTNQVTALAEALRQGTPNRNRIAMQMVKDVLDESSFDASPGGFIPTKVGQAISGVAEKLRDRTDAEHPE